MEDYSRHREANAIRQSASSSGPQSRPSASVLVVEFRWVDRGYGPLATPRPAFSARACVVDLKDFDHIWTRFHTR